MDVYPYHVCGMGVACVCDGCMCVCWVCVYGCECDVFVCNGCDTRVVHVCVMCMYLYLCAYMYA